eukprot:gene58995-80794_t
MSVVVCLSFLSLEGDGVWSPGPDHSAAAALTMTALLGDTPGLYKDRDRDRDRGGYPDLLPAGSLRRWSLLARFDSHVHPQLAGLLSALDEEGDQEEDDDDDW